MTRLLLSEQDNLYYNMNATKIKFAGKTKRKLDDFKEISQEKVTYSYLI